MEFLSGFMIGNAFMFVGLCVLAVWLDKKTKK